MAKKRVHEIAKAKGVSSKELLAALKAAGVEAKAAASSVEEGEALKALSAAEGNGGGVATEAKPATKPAAAKPKARGQSPLRPTNPPPRLPQKRPPNRAGAETRPARRKNGAS